MNDSLGQPDPKVYNTIHWDGASWELKKIYFPTVCGSTNLTPYPAKSIFSFNDGEIWISSSGDKVAILQDGNQVNQFCLPSNVSMSINKIWGSSSSDLYVAGNNGNIAWYNGTSWRKIYSNTELHLYDIDGKYSELEKAYEILVTAANRFVSFEKKILKISNAVSVIPMVTDGIPYSVKGIWFESDRQYYVCGGGVFNKKNIEDATAWKELEVSEYYTEAIDVNGINDIVLCGDFGELLHFNGVNWKSYQELFSGILLLNISIKQDLIVSVGIDNPKAFITIGKR